ncbi:protein kinase, partial [Acinetobacter baumannii]
MRREGRMSTELAADLFIPICLALSHAHQEGIIHRDIKPGNIMLASTGSGGQPVPKLVDFGIAKLMLGEAGTLTQAGEIFGTPY